MHYLPLGRSNLLVSKFCLGTMMFGGKTNEEESIKITRAAMAAGINFIDTADVYNAGASETILGKAFGGVGGGRDSVVLASKAGMKVGEGVNDVGVSRFHIVRAVEASLKRLNTDRIDLFYLHWPMTAMNMEESLRAIDDLIRAGKILYAASSNFPAWLVCRSNWIAEVNKLSPLVCGQYPYNLIERGLEIEILPMAQASRFGICIYRPVAIGVLTGKYLRQTAAAGADDFVAPADARGVSDERIPKWTRKYADGLRKLTAYAKSNGKTLLELANAWVASHPGVTSVIVGISSQSQLEENLRGVAWQMNESQRAEIAGLIPTEILEEAGGMFPTWRRRADIGAW
jgi:aryl-alcohol dehydrogenase-like predicted oxidoreductase